MEKGAVARKAEFEQLLNTYQFACTFHEGAGETANQRIKAAHDQLVEFGEKFVEYKSKIPPLYKTWNDGSNGMVTAVQQIARQKFLY